MDENSENLKFGIDVYNDNKWLENELGKYSTFKDKIDFLNEVKNKCNDKILLKSHVEYLKKKYHEPIKKKVYVSAVLFCTCIILIAVLLNTDYIAKKYYNISVNNDVYIQAKNYYYEGDYEAAYKRFTNLVSNGWDGYALFYYCSMIAQAEGSSDDGAMLPIEYFINQYYGVENIAGNNLAYERLRSLYEANEMAGTDSERVKMLLEKADQYIDAYSELDRYLDEENYQLALYTCKMLLNQGACNYKLTTAYVYSLVAEKDYKTAYDYIMFYLENLSSYQEHTISKEQKIALVGFIKPFLYGKEYEECCQYIESLIDLQKSTSYENTPYEIPVTLVENVDSVKERMTLWLGMLGYSSAFDTITVQGNTCIVRGRECYSVQVDHKDGNNTFTNYFFLCKEYSREKNYLYVSLNGKYVDISNVLSAVYIEGLSDEKSVVGNYVGDNGLTITISEKDDTSFEFLIRDRNTNKVFLEKTNIPWIHKNICAKYVDESTEVYFYWGENDNLVIMVKIDTQNQYRRIESVYTLENSTKDTQSMHLEDSIEDTQSMYLEDKMEYSSMEEYDSYISVIADTSRKYDGTGSFALYDLDQDGVRELITSAGTSSADWENWVYTLEDGKVSMIGSFYSSVGLYVAPDGNGLYTVYGFMGHEVVERLVKKGNEIAVQPVQTRELAAGEEYYTNENPVEWQYFNEAEPASDEIFSGIYESYEEEPIYGDHIFFYEKDGVLMADVSVSKKYRETVVMRGNTGIAADGTPVFSIEKTEEDRIFVKYHSLRKASKWLTKPGTFAFNYTGEVSASDGA